MYAYAGIPNDHLKAIKIFRNLQDDLNLDVAILNMISIIIQLIGNTTKHNIDDHILRQLSQNNKQLSQHLAWGDAIPCFKVFVSFKLPNNT